MSEIKKIMEKIPLLVLGLPLSVLGMLFAALIREIILPLPFQITTKLAENLYTAIKLTSIALPYISILPVMMYLGYLFLLTIYSSGKYLATKTNLIKENKNKEEPEDES